MTDQLKLNRQARASGVSAFPLVHIAKSRPLSRRTFLAGTGIASIGLPLLEAMSPSIGQRALAVAAEQQQSPKRFVAMCATLGFHTPSLFPETEGRDFELTPYLEKLADHRDQITLLSGLSHPQQQGNNGHASELTWLTAAQRPGLAGFKNTVSLDQLIAQQIGVQTRYPYLALSTSGRSMSWTSNGVEIPGMTSPSKLFAALFIDGTADEIEAEMNGLRRGKSILDTIGGRARELQRTVGRRDQEKVDEYLTAVRSLEKRLLQSEDWVRRPKPHVDAQRPTDVADKNDAIAKQRLLYDLIVMALQTDSTRTITYQLSGMNAVPAIPGVSNDWHGLSHHGKDPEKISELQKIEQAEFEVLGEFLTKLRAIEENGKSLLDHTAVMFGSNLGNASAHDWHNLPLVVAGGGYAHGAYVAHDATDNTPLSNLYVEFAQRMGVEIDQFGSSTAAGVRGLNRPG
ncbi:DUF1552 domain-containing protein [Rubripirellula reticaptiva]|uniref:DUF1552 domain-containing protein n=1 Tax=Rubripirellula reticaptiva TaxID=2528013 RepID=A0A5C6EN94_9BACT|nr:DUF1552 domain-containing protein [Rubripirellula reticaptiva]TWU49844.1 hypothetical protein Poly59_44690 [Rubripirellula reticaptiva]